MESLLEHAAVGVLLLTAGAFGLARAAIHFRATDTGADRFASTSMASVTLVALLVGGVFYLGNAVLDVDGATRFIVAIAAIAYTVVVPPLIWRLFGPRSAVSGAGALV